MKTSAQVVVIGGGVVGCSVLYHLTKLGWSDVILVERSELTSGSTWHAAGGFHTLNGDTNMAALQGYTIKLYKELEEITGMSCGLHHVGGVTLADDKDRFDMLLAERAKHRYMGLETEIIGTDQIKKIAPVTNINGIVGGLYDPLDGHLDPSGTTYAYAKAASIGGAEIEIKTKVIKTNQRLDGSWDVVTDRGNIHTEHVVNAAGLWAREVAAMAGLYLPLHPMEHQYIITDDIAEIYGRNSEHPHVMDPSGESYLRQEGRGLCIGFYEQNCRPWAVDGTPWDFGPELLPDDFDKINESIEFAYKRFPVLKSAGIKRVIHGPFTFAPDGNPLIGPVPGIRNYWSACGVMAGFSQGGGVGLMLAQWMIQGETDRDIMAMDVARFGSWTTKEYTLPKVIENYKKRFSVSYPNEELKAARPLRTTPMYDIFENMGAVWGAQYGLEVANYFAEGDEPRYETPSFRRSNAFDAIRREVMVVRNNVGINETHNFGKYCISGPNARTWLNKIMAGNIPTEGRVSITPMLSHNGRILGDFTVSCIGEKKFQVTGSYSSQAYHMRWFTQNQSSGVEIDNISDTLTGFQVAGPNARKVLDAVSMNEITSLEFFDVRQMLIGIVECLVQRVSYTGGLGYEIYCKHNEQIQLWDILWTAGQLYNMKPFGMRAMMSLRLDKFFGSWMSEFSPDYTAGETGLDRFIAWSKPDFIGRTAAMFERQNGVKRKLVAFEVETEDVDAVAYAPVWIDGRVEGFCTSGGFSHFTQKSVALALIPRELAKSGIGAEIEIFGKVYKARILEKTLLQDNQASRVG